MISKQNLPKVLICDDDKNIHLAIKAALGNEYDIKSAYNLYKEQKEEWLPDYILVANEFLKAHRPDIKAIIIKEIESYYAEDKMIWRLFFSADKPDLSLFEMR